MVTPSAGNAIGGPKRHNIPRPLTSLIGRKQELRGVAEALRRTRLVTVTGPGGVGKTRLAIEFALDQTERRLDGVWLVDLARGPGTPDVASEAARILDVRAGRGSTPTEALRAYLADRDLLLVLDNCEHVVDACAEFASALLTFCPNARIVATSRESLGVSAETVWRLEPLRADDAHRLFVERARQRRPEFIPTPDADAAIAELCDRLDRLPLAIELAAARVSVFSPQEILSALETRLDVLGSGMRTSSRRHRTVGAVVEWSYELLDRREQAAIRSLAVFAGGFDADAAESVVPALSVDVLARLVDKSLIAVAERAAGRTRYRLLETVREYARGLLDDAGELDGARDRHLAYYTRIVHPSSAGPVAWPSPSAERLVNDCGPDYGNLRAALEWGVARDPCAARSLFFAARDLFLLLGQSDGYRLAQELLERCPTRDRERLEVEITAGLLAMMTVDIEAATRFLRDAQELALELDEPALGAWATFFCGLTATLAADFDSAQPYLDECRAVHHRLGMPIGEGLATAALGLGAAMKGNPERGQELLQEALSLQVAEGYHWGQGQARVYLAIIAERSGAAPERVTEHSREAVESLRRYRDSSLLPMALVCQASTLVRADSARALRIAAAASAIRARIGGGFPPAFHELADRVLTEAKAALGSEAESVSAAAGRLTAEDAIALAFGTPRPRPSAPAGLSARELEVARLVAEGLSNKTIASRLQLSVRTVESHVRHALSKLALENRTQLATWARERIQ